MSIVSYDVGEMNVTKQITNTRELLTKLTAFFSVTLQTKGNEELKDERWNYFGEELMKDTCPQIDLFNDVELILEVVPKEYFYDIFNLIFEMSDYSKRPVLITISAPHFNPQHLKIIDQWFTSGMECHHSEAFYFQVIKEDSWQKWIVEFSHTDFRSLEETTFIQAFTLMSKSFFIIESIESHETSISIQRAYYFLDCIKAGLYPWNYDLSK